MPGHEWCRCRRGWPVPQALRRSRASAPRTSPIGIRSDGGAARSGPDRRARRRRPWCAGATRFGARHWQFARIFDQHHPIGGAGALGEQRVGEGGLAGRGATGDQDILAGGNSLAQYRRLARGHDAGGDIVVEGERRQRRACGWRRSAPRRPAAAAPSNRSPVSGSSAETRGEPGCTSAPTWWATRRTIRSPSAADITRPLSSRPPDSGRSTAGRPG